MTRRYAKPLRQNRTESGTLLTCARDWGNLAIGCAVIGALYVTNVVLSVWDVTRPGQGEAFRPSGGYGTRRG